MFMWVYSLLILLVRKFNAPAVEAASRNQGVSLVPISLSGIAGLRCGQLAFAPFEGIAGGCPCCVPMEISSVFL